MSRTVSNNSTQALLTPYTLGDLKLKNRVVMAPLTRTRAENQGKVPNELMAEYYAQRAGAGLIITEGTFVSEQGQGWYGAPGVYSEEQRAGWKRVTDGSGANAHRTDDDRQMPRFIPTEELFKGRHFDQEIVVLCVRWYLSFKLSFRDLVAMMGERDIGLAHTTILRWVQHYTPEFEKRWKRYARAVGGSWRMDETYVKVRGEWVYLYRAVDKAGKTVDFYLSRKRDVNAAKAFLRKAMKDQRIPTKVTLDAYAASHRAVTDLKASGELPKRVQVRTSKYLNNAIEQDHRRIKQRLRPMLGLNSLQTALVVIGGIELAEKIKKGQFKLGKLGGRTATMPEIWQAALAA